MIHVIPNNDWIEHKEEGTTCVCEPRLEIENGEMIVIHNSADGRELHERNRKLITLLTNIAQLLDGWHTDVAWTDWDESIRKEVGETLKKLYQENNEKTTL